MLRDKEKYYVGGFNLSPSTLLNGIGRGMGSLTFCPHTLNPIIDGLEFWLASLLKSRLLINLVTPRLNSLQGSGYPPLPEYVYPSGHMLLCSHMLAPFTGLKKVINGGNVAAINIRSFQWKQ